MTTMTYDPNKARAFQKNPDAINGYSKNIGTLTDLLYAMDEVGYMPWDTSVVVQDSKGNQYPVKVMVIQNKVVILPEVTF